MQSHKLGSIHALVSLQVSLPPLPHFQPTRQLSGIEKIRHHEVAFVVAGLLYMVYVLIIIYIYILWLFLYTTHKINVSILLMLCSFSLVNFAITATLIYQIEIVD